MLFPNVIYVLS